MRTHLGAHCQPVSITSFGTLSAALTCLDTDSENNSRWDRQRIAGGAQFKKYIRVP